MYSIVALNIHSPQLGKIGKYKRGKLGIICLFVCLMVFSANFNNISAISLGYVLLVPPMVEETGGFGENHQILSNRSTQNHVGEPRYFEIN
jgi:hypothetical protein